MSDKKRTYVKRQRAESEAATRLRITESAVELHGSLGPARTSVSAIAEHAGVRRSTVYRHFADEDAIFEACSSHWSEANPLPDPAGWPQIADDGARLEHALAELYAFYEHNETMLANLYRDAMLVPVVGRLFAGMDQYFAAATAAARPKRARRKATAATGHALAFTTWRSLVREQGLARRDAMALMLALVRGAQRPDSA